MVVTEIVEAAHDVHTSGNGFCLLRQTARPTGQPGQTLPEGSVESFNIGGIDDANGSLRRLT